MARKVLTQLDFPGGTLSGRMLVNGNGNIVYENDNGVYIPRPQNATYRTTTATVTGALSIQLPTSLYASSSDMLSFWVDIYDYATNESLSVYVSGYVYNSSGNWVSCSAAILTSNANKDFTVRFCHDGTRHVVCIGETNSTWDYPQVTVRDFQAGFTAAANNSDDGWAITFLTTLPTVMQTATGNLVVAKSATTATTANAVPWSGVTSKPTTLSGFGITDAVTTDTTQTVSGQKTFSAAATLFSNAAYDLRVLASSLDASAPSIQSYNSKPLYLNPLGNAVYIGSQTALHTGNYNTYAPTLTGTGASGTWGINVTGNAATVTNGVYTTGDQTIAGKKVMTPTVATGASTEQAFRIAPNTLAGAPEWRNMFNLQSTYNAGVNGHGFYIKANASNQFEIVTDWSTHLRLGVITNAGNAANATAAKYLNLTTAAITWDGNALLDAANYTTYTVTKTGTGASGTWGISITGNAATVTDYNSGTKKLWSGTQTQYNALTPQSDTLYYITDATVPLASWTTLTDKPTTVTGFGITDVYTKTQSDVNYPTKAGAGATGSWGISVTGSSASCTGNAATVTNGVYTTGNQTIAGDKTFSGTTALAATSTINGAVVGYRDVPVTISNAATTFALADAGKAFGKDNATAYTYTIPANGTVAFPIGTVITVFNNNATSNITVAITTDTLRLAGTTTTGSRTVAPFALCTLFKVSSTVWLASGAGVT